MSVLIFGGAGFLGSHLVRKLVDEGEDVVALDVGMPDPPMPPLVDVRDRFTFETCQTEQLSEVLRAMRNHKAESVINLVTSFAPAFELNPQRGLRINLDTQTNILEAARILGLGRVVCASSTYVYGAGRPELVDETSLVRPDTLYGACKAMNEYLARHYHENFGVDSLSVRFSLIMGWGRGQRKVLGRRGPWIVELFENPLKGLPVRLPYAAAKTSVVYVKDMVGAVLAALRVKDPVHRVFNIVGEPICKADAAKIVKRILPDAQIEVDLDGDFGDDRPSDHATIPAWEENLMVRELGYRIRYSIEDAVADYIKMAQEGRFSW